MTLHPYQQLMVRHLMAHDRAALFVGVGLGKTAATLEAFDGLRSLSEAQSMLVVAPLRVCNLTWPNEVAQWAPHLKVCNLRGRAGYVSGADIYLCNYEMLPTLADRIPEMPDVVVFDELTRAKNHASKRINGLRKLLPQDGRRWGLTGTPTPNSLLELFAQIRLLDDGKRFGPSFDAFQRAYFHATDYMEYNWEIDPGAEAKIHAKISDIALTLLSSEYLHIPDTVVADIEVAMPEEAQAQYDELEKELLLSIGEGEHVIVAPNAAVLVNKLLQVAGGSAYSETGATVPIHSAKLDAVKAYIKQHPEPLLIAYNYRHELERLRQLLPGAIAFEDAKKAEIQTLFEREWNAGKIKHLLVHPQSVGHGLNLQHGGNTVLWFSPTWSREMYDQLNGRVARQGQRQITRIVRIICPGTIDDAVIETLRQKGDGQTALLTALSNLRKLKAAA